MDGFREIAVLFAGCGNAVFPIFWSDTADKAKDALLMAAVSAIKEKYGPDTRMVMEFDEDAPSLPKWVFGETDHVDRWGLVQTVIL